MKAYVILAIIIIAIPIIFYTVEEVLPSCSCKGIGNNYCLGKITCEEKKENNDCIPLTCESKEHFLGIEQSKSIQTYSVLIIDASKSMEGENLDATIKASKTFIQKIDETAYVAIIEFNDKAQLLSEFTNDKIKLYNSIELINPRGRTKFHEPFSIANNLFENAPKQADKYILFLSDGEPEDDKETFMKEIEKLEEKKVHIYAISFEGKSNEKLMRSIASHSSNLFSVKTAQDIEEKFILAYTSIREGRDLAISVVNQEEIMNAKDSIKTRLLSKHTNEKLLEQSTYCPYITSNYLEVENEKGEFSRIKGEVIEDEIHYPLHELSTGTYEANAHSRILLEGCAISSSTTIKPFKIVKQEECAQSCEEISTLMKGNKTFAYEREGDTSISWNILIDKSSSMESQKYLEKAIQDTKKILSLLPVQDTVSIGSFDTKTDMISYHQQAFLFDKNSLETISPSASTNLRFAMEKATELEQDAPSKQTHTIIISDGKYGEEYIAQINSSLHLLKGCISTINYGVHTLTQKEKTLDLIKKYRKCGKDIATQPSQEELEELLSTNKTTTPRLLIQLQEQQNRSKQVLEIKTISTFTGKEPRITTDNCQEKPLIKITTITDGVESIKEDTSFHLKENETFKIIASFGHGDCQYETIKYSQPQEEESKTKTIIKIVLIIVIVLCIHLVVFTIVMNKKLKQLEKMIKRK